MLRAVGYRGSGGLGKRENGAVEPVRVRVKRDRRGVGDPSAETYEVVGERRTAAKTRNATIRRPSRRWRRRGATRGGCSG